MIECSVCNFEHLPENHAYYRNETGDEHRIEVPDTEYEDSTVFCIQAYEHYTGTLS